MPQDVCSCLACFLTYTCTTPDGTLPLTWSPGLGGWGGEEGANARCMSCEHPYHHLSLSSMRANSSAAAMATASGLEAGPLSSLSPVASLSLSLSLPGRTTGRSQHCRSLELSHAQREAKWWQLDWLPMPTTVGGKKKRKRKREMEKASSLLLSPPLPASPPLHCDVGLCVCYGHGWQC